MKILFYFFLLIIFCGGCMKQEIVENAIQIGDIGFTAEEFKKAYTESRFSNSVEPQSKTEFLTEYINKKLILHEAEKLGLDKDPEFLKDLQIFWEQALLKRMLIKKSNEFLNDNKSAVSDVEIKNYYEKHKEDYYIGKELVEAYDGIRWFLIQEKQKKLLQKWVDLLQKNCDLKVNYQQLGILKDK